MTLYIIGVIHALDVLCNLAFIVTTVGFLIEYPVIWTYRKYMIITMIIGLLGVLFIPDHETLKVLFGQ